MLILVSFVGGRLTPSAGQLASDVFIFLYRRERITGSLPPAASEEVAPIPVWL